MKYLLIRFLLLSGAFIYAGQVFAQHRLVLFQEENKPKNAEPLEFIEIKPYSGTPTVHVTVFPSDTVARVSPYIYGNNANVYMSQMVTEEKLMHHIRLLSPPIIRYPGGNLSNLFFWNAAPGELPADVPDPLWSDIEKRTREKYWYGMNNSPKRLSIDNYYRMLDEVNAKGIICVNYSYARYGLSHDLVARAAHLAAEWVRYDKGRTRFWEIGNENYGSWQAGYRIDTSMNKDGQPEIITGDLYGKHFRIFADSMRKAAAETGAVIQIGAVLVEIEKNYGTEKERSWNDDFFKAAGNAADFFVVHSYYTPYMEDSDIPTILNSAATETLKMSDHIGEVCRRNQVDLKPAALTEWNIFADGSKQSCSYISGMHAVLVLGELIKNQFGMANRWNFANAYDGGDDHGMFNRGDECWVPKWNPRPAFFYMVYFRKFFGDHMIKTQTSGNDDIVVYGSSFDSCENGLIVINKGNSSQTLNIKVELPEKQGRYYYYSLTGGKDNGDFSQQVFVNGCAPSHKTGGPIDQLTGIKAFSSTYATDGITIESPAYSVQFIRLD